MNNLVGRKITSVRYMTDQEQKDFGWYKKAVVITLDDGSVMFPMSDDEGNDAGVIQVFSKEGETLLHTI